MLEMLEGMCRVLLCMLEVLEVPEVMRCVLLCMLEAVEGGLCLLEAVEVTLLLPVCWKLRMVGSFGRRCWR